MSHGGGAPLMASREFTITLLRELVNVQSPNVLLSALTLTRLWMVFCVVVIFPP